MPSFIKMLPRGIEFHTDCGINRLRIAELLIVRSQGPREPHFQVFEYGTACPQQIACHDGALKHSVVENARVEFRGVKVSADESTAREIARIKSAIPQVTSIERGVAKIYVFEPPPLRDKTDELAVVEINIGEVLVDFLVFNASSIGRRKHTNTMRDRSDSVRAQIE
jgi:hypothetical protein